MAKTKSKDEASAGETGDVYVSFKSNVPNHTRHLSAADFKRAGVEHKAVNCGAGEVVKVSQEAADYLVDELGDFEVVDPEDVEEDVDEPALATHIQDTIPGDGDAENAEGGGGSQVGANVRDGAGARSATVNR